MNGKQGILYAQDGISLVPHPYRGSYIKTKYRGWGDFQQYDFRPSGPFYVVVGFDCVGSTNGSAIFEFEVDNETKAVRIDFDSSTESWTCDSWEDPQICEDLWQYLEISWDSYKGAFEVQPQVEVTANDDSCVRFTYDLIGVGTTTDALDAVFDNLENKADKYYAVASAEYVSSSTTINFMNVDGDVISSIDASAFVIDGMIDDVRIDTISGETYLVIDFNTASGKEDIEIPISDIFDADNYYTKNEVDSAISAATSGKQDTLIAGENITISGNVISASGGGATYIAGDGINIDSANTISATFEGFVGAYEETSFENIDTDFYLKIANDCNPYSSEDIEGTAHTKVNIDGQDCIYIVIIHSLSHTYSVEPYNELSPIDGWQDFFSIEWEDDVEMYKITVLQEIAEFSDAGCTRVVQESEVWIDASGTTTNALKWFKTYSDNEINGIYGSIDDLYNRKQDKLSAGTGINISNNVISASGSGAVELTQAQYDALVSAGTVSTDTLYIITDATPIDLSPYWTSAQTQSAITEEISAATSGKVDTSSVVTAVTSASTDSEIPTAKAVYDAVGSGGGGGTTYSAGTNIDITNDTISCTLPIEESGGGIILRNSGNSNAGANLNSKNTIIGYECKTLKDISSYQTLFGTKLQTYNNSEFACGFANVSHSGSTLFSVGNGSNEYVRHNAFEIRQNGDIYISSGGTDILLQDNLGGGSITIDQSLDSGSTNPVANSAITSALTVDTVFLENYDGETIPTIVKLDKITKIYVSFNGSYTSTWNFVATMGNNNTWTANQSLTPYNSDENNYAKSYKLTNQGYSDTAVLEAKEGYWFWDVSFSSTNPANVKTFKSVEGGYVNSVLPSVIGIVDEMEVALDNKINSHTANTSVHHTSTSAVTSGSTDVVTSGGVYDQLGGLKLQQITQAAYDALVSGGTVDSSTLYIITNVVN